MRNPQGCAWYALYVRTNCERIAACGLDELRVRHFLPTYRTRREGVGNVRWLDKPLFPGYLFCNIDLDRGPKLYNVPGMIKIVNSGRSPAPISESEIDSIRLIIGSNVPISPSPFLTRGEEVIIADGPLRGITGLYRETQKSGRLVISFPLLQRSINISLEPGWIESSHSHNREHR
jgi:transcription antitermination factor NusG